MLPAQRWELGQKQCLGCQIITGWMGKTDHKQIQLLGILGYFWLQWEEVDGEFTFPIIAATLYFPTRPRRYLEGGEGVRGDVEGGHLHVVEEAVEVVRLEDDLGERLVADALPQHDAAVQRHLGRLVPFRGGGG